MILEKKVDGIIHLESKTSTKVFETEYKDRKPKPSFDLTSKPVAFEPANFNCLEESSYLDNLEEPSYLDHSKERPIASFKSKQDNHESCDSEINLHFAYQPLED